MADRIRQVRAAGDSVGGLVECRVRNLPVGLGAPVLIAEADLAKAMLALATKGFEVGSGFDGCWGWRQRYLRQQGRQGRHGHQPPGGVQGGISNGEGHFSRHSPPAP